MSRTIRISVCLMLCVILAVFSATAEDFKRVKPEKVGMSSERLDLIGQAMQDHVDDGHIAGSVTMVARRGMIVHSEAIGYRDIKSKSPMTTDVIFSIASMTKPISTAALMILCDEGKVKLSDPVYKYIPEFKDVKVHKSQYDTIHGPYECIG